jgi:hypothetical protein
MGDLDDQVEACRRIFESDARWTVVRGSKLEEGASEVRGEWDQARACPSPWGVL